MSDALPTSLMTALVFMTVCSMPLAARAAPSTDPPPDASDLQDLFARGVDYQKAQDWNHALVAFREALSRATGRRKLAAIRFNIAVCERALGHYLAARQELLLLESIRQELDPDRAEEAARYSIEIERLIVRVEVELTPAEASLSVDGAPLIPDLIKPNTFTAGLSHDEEKIRSLALHSFVIYLDPAAHIFRANRPGHAEAVLKKSYREGESARLQLALDVLPATIAVQSEPPGAIVRVDKQEVGVTPLEIRRAAGTYRLEVERDEYTLHRQTLSVQSGERIDVTAPLSLYKPALTERWWFWTGALTLAAAISVGVYFAARPKPQPPPYDAGSSGWIANAP